MAVEAQVREPRLQMDTAGALRCLILWKEWAFGMVWMEHSVYDCTAAGFTVVYSLAFRWGKMGGKVSEHERST